MFNYEALQVIWWMIIGMMLVVYATTAGFDLGVAMIMPFFRQEMDRRILLNTSAPVWDGNNTWLIFIGGALFVVWPVVYSTLFSGLYAALLLVLWTFALRPPGYDYRSKLESHTWRRFWDTALFISAFCSAGAFGLIFGNCFIGFPFYFDPITMRSFWQGNFGDLLNGFSLLCAACSILMVLSHGSMYIQRRTEGPIRERARWLHLIFSVLLLIGFTCAGIILATHLSGYELVSSPAQPTIEPLKNVVSQGTGMWLAQWSTHPWKYYGPLLAYLGILMALFCNYHRWYATGFWASVFGVGGIIATAGFTLFPFLAPSSIQPAQSLTVWNAVSSQYALNIMLYVGVVILMIILAYKIFCYYSLWHAKKTITEQDVKDNPHTFY